MKPIKLEIEGLNSFENRQVIDFEKVGKGVFGIFGKTGSGKSTILDAMTLALYGEVERSKQNIDFINTKRRKTIVSLDFEILTEGEVKRFSVMRTFSIRKNGKDVESSACLYELEDDVKKLIVEGAIKVNEKVLEIIGLGRNEFVKCIALPQGEFSAFLKARQSERTEILSNIFDLSKYGDELCQKVRAKTVEFDKQVTALSASLSIVEYATDEELEKAREKFNNCNDSYKREKDNLSEKTNLYSKMTVSLEKKKKLEEINSSYEDLMLKSEEMNELEVEIAKNQSANVIKSDYEKLEKGKKDEKELSEKLKEIDENRKKINIEFEEVSSDFEKFKQEYNFKIVEYNQRIAKINDLMQFEKEENNLKQEQEVISKDIENINKELVLEQEKLNYITSNLVKIEEDIEKIDDFIKANKSDVDLSYALEQTKGIESEIILIDEIIKNIETMFDQTSDDLNIAQAEYDSSIKQEKKLTEKIEQIQNSINVAFEDIDKTNFNKIRSCDKQLDNMKQNSLKANWLQENISKLIYDKESRQANVASLNEKIEKTQNELQLIENYISEGENFVKNEKERREELLGSNFFSLVSNQMRIGDDCPICGSQVVQKTYDEVYDLSPVNEEIAKSEADLKELISQRDKILTELVSLKAINQFERKQVEIDKQEIDKLSKAEVDLYGEFVEINEHSKENFNKLFKLLSDTSENLEKLIDLQDMLREQQLELIIRKTQSGVKITIYKDYIEKFNDILYDLKKKKAEREIAVFNMNEKYQNLKEYKKQIAEGKNIELVIDGKKEEKYTLKDNQTKLMIEKSTLEKNIADISSKIAVLNEKLANSCSKSTELRKKIVENGIPEGLSVSEENKIIHEKIENLKLDYSKKETMVESSRELLSRVRNEYSINFSILSSKQNEIAELQKKIDFALVKNHFKDSLDLESYFADTADVKEKQAKLNDFKTKLKLIETQKRDLEVESFENVTDEKVHQLKLDLDVLTTNVQELSEQVGRQSAEFEKLEKDNKKMNEIAKELAYSNHNLDIAKELASVLKGKALAEYVAEEYLQEITIVANQKLNLLLDGKYNLKFVGKEFVVEDNFNDGQIRSASTLSGGETFLVSLSLAFAISDAISMLSSRCINFFFLDEGFGTLDSELCEVVVSALHKLESQNLNIGLISHVNELAESIKNKILVEKTPTGSKISIEHSL